MTNGLSIQQKLEVQNIKEGVVLVRGGLRAVLAVSSVNFALKSFDEQKAIIARYQEFLNSLDFPIEILITSRKYDISDYIELLSSRAKQQKNELLKIQTAEYIDFIKNLAELTNIMTKNFYVVVPYAQLEKAVETFGEKMLNLFRPKTQDAPTTQTFAQQKSQLWQRVDYVISGLTSIGLRAVALNTEELTELFYKLYNPEAKETVKKEEPDKNQP
ncbi:MAG: hypothetical protein COU85_01735 [Candidatus Portnoybacteria bacterium CG10_big_fil_rev_8_21_14_0_10_44_7]|uniref:TraC-like domain-containing protein n=1 Tax=Candidatus Portnoybacteria bacterium CG10_big_fil_rev_8_21_14_0_10_44_7 TaxID=1974816 RepID=A0A2M8KIR1_9BACT|nr:MAG: hypothetical protein COU85_01735 [Candidatus Portnoybacteria bacterium CG10_big_fil_rev_8_21_14_0_10_44_7]